MRFCVGVCVCVRIVRHGDESRTWGHRRVITNARAVARDIEKISRGVARAVRADTNCISSDIKKKKKTP